MSSSSRQPLITAPTSHEAPPKTTYFDVTVISASGLPKVGMTHCYSKFYVKVAVDGTQKVATKAVGSRSPRWNQTFSLISNNASPQFTVELCGKRHVLTDKVIACFSHVVTTTENGDSKTFNENIVSVKGYPVGRLEFTVKSNTNGDPTDVARVAVEGLNTPGVMQKMGEGVEGIEHAVDAAGVASDQVQSVEAVVSPLIANLKIFVDLVTEISKVHPYAKAAWEIISLAYKTYDRQRRMDDNVRELFNTMNALYTRINNFRERVGSSNSEFLKGREEILLHVAKQTLECSYFIQEYCQPSFTKRLVEHIVKSADNKINEYINTFEKMEKEFERGVFEGTYMVSAIILDQVTDLHVQFDLEQIPFTPGASLLVSTNRQCLPGTRIDTLADIVDWADRVRAESQSQRVLLLTGVAGSGKSTIARTIASHFEKIGRLGASFAFSRQDKSRRIEQIFPHIARMIAGCGSMGNAVKKRLAEVVSTNVELRAGNDIRIQFERLLVTVLKGLTIVGPIVIVIDAIDEASDGTYEGVAWLKELVAVITDPDLALPSNIRIIVTSRPEKAILDGVKGYTAVLRKDMGDISRDSADNDISLYVKNLLSSTGINEQYYSQIALMSEGLFQFASVACKEILNPRGPPPETQCKRIVHSGVKGLDKLYESVLEDHFDTDCLTDFVSVMSFIFALQEPVSAGTLRRLWQAAENDVAVLDNVLEKMRSLLDGVEDPTKAVQPSHTSFRDFSLDSKRSKGFFISKAVLQKAQNALVLACFHVMGDQLRFNMCNIESSYRLNKDIPHLDVRAAKCIQPECLYACCFWAVLLEHVEETKKFISNAVFQDVLKVFLTEKLLFWLEVLSVFGKMSIALPAMSVLTAHLTKNRGIENTVPISLAKDAQEFVGFCAPAASLSAPHIYLSALPFVTPTSAIFTLYSPLFPRLLKVVDAAEVLKVTSAVRNTIHCPSTRHVAVSPDGTLIAANSGKDIIVFNIHTGEHTSDKLCGHDSNISELQFSGDGARLASCSFDMTVRLWDMKTRKAVGEPLRGHTNWVRSVAWSRDGQCVVSGSRDRTVRAWDTSSGKKLWCTNIGYIVRSVAYSPDGALIAAAGNSDDITLLSSDGGPTGVLSGHRGWIHSVAFSRHGTRLASGSADETVRVWDVETRSQIGEPLEGHTDMVWAASFSPLDDNQIASVSLDCTLRLWKLGATKPIAERVLGSTNSLVFTPDGASIVTVSRDGVTVWDTDRYTTENAPHHTGWVTCLAFSPTGSQIVSGSNDTTVRIWDSTTGNAIGKPLAGHPGYVTAIAVSPDGALIVSGSGRALYLWDMATPQRVGNPLEGHKSTVQAVCFSNDGRRILSCSESELLIWDRDTHALLSDGKSKFPVAHLNSFTFGPDHKLLIGESWLTDKVLLWDVTLQEPRGSPWSVHRPTSVAISPDGSKIALGQASGKVSVWKLSGERLQLFKGHQGWVRAMAFSPDGARIASGSDDRTIRITNVESGQIIGHPIQCGGKVISLAFTADGTRLASGSSNAHVRIWDVSPESLVSGYTGPLVFSYDAGHAMPSLETLFMPSCPPDDDIREHIRLDRDGFVIANVENEDRLLFWVPSHLRHDLLLPWRYMVAQMGAFELDLSQFVYGTDWTRCYSLSPSD